MSDKQPTIHKNQLRRSRAPPLWQIVRHGWDDFLTNYKRQYRKSLGPLHRRLDRHRRVPRSTHRQFVFTIPRVLRGIFRKRRQLPTHLFHTAIEK